MWKWEKITMDFIVGLPCSPKGNDSIWVIVDRLTKSAHFISVKANYNASRLAELYIQNILRLHGAPLSIVSDRGPQFTARFWKSLQRALDTKLDYSTAYHPQTDGQTERVNQLLEDLLRACVLTYGPNWEDSLPFAEFSYNNSYQASIGMSPFQALYGRQCRTPLMWEETGERQFFGPAMFVEAAENVAKVRENLRIAQSRQKSYADKRRRELTFEEGEFVYLKVIKKLILSEAHDTAYSIHPGSTKMYHDLKERFWWYGMKRAVAEYVAVCDTCQRVKAEHQRPAGLLQPLKIPEWKWEEISMDFIVGLPRTQKGYNSIWVVVDRLTKVAHFIPVNYLFGCKLHDSLDSKLRFGTAYHPRTDGRTERTNQILEDMLRACAIQYGTSWDKSLPYAEFSYNNSYQAGPKKSPFEAPYGEGEKQVFGPDLIKDAEHQIKMVRENLRVAQSRQKSYADVRRRDLTFKVDDFVYLKVSPMRGIRRFNMKGKAGTKIHWSIQDSGKERRSGL
ncbi:hypothetical protein U9M48_043033 [Paspalum notatum var. saurae]|uniref:Integrase catalytic domain-containing protein n=1 Tax=Paspalum notatum var. saurae TaxID=547442 RepID=A0AAQ3XF71_PASNO